MTELHESLAGLARRLDALNRALGEELVRVRRGAVKTPELSPGTPTSQSHIINRNINEG
jgi:hypothetical protein